MPAKANDPVHFQVQSPDGKSEAVTYSLITHNSAKEHSQFIQQEAQDPRLQATVLHGEEKDLRTFSQAIKTISERDKKIVVTRGQPGEFASLIGKHSETIWKTVTVVVSTGSAYMSWHYLGGVGVTPSAILTAWTFLTASYLNFAIENFHSNINRVTELGTKALQKAFNLSGINKLKNNKFSQRLGVSNFFDSKNPIWRSSVNKLSLFFLTFSIHATSLYVLDMHSFTNILKTSIPGFLASDLITSGLNSLANDRRLKWDLVYKISYIRASAFAFIFPLYILNTYVGWVGVGAFVGTGILLNFERTRDYIVRYNMNTEVLTLFNTFKIRVRNQNKSIVRTCEARFVGF